MTTVDIATSSDQRTSVDPHQPTRPAWSGVNHLAW